MYFGEVYIGTIKKKSQKGIARTYLRNTLSECTEENTTRRCVMEKVSLQTLNGGAVIDLFNVEYEKLLANVNDENTKPEATRSIKIELKVKPEKTRRVATVQISVASSLAPIKPAETVIFFDTDKGELAAFEDDPKQQSLDFKSGAVGAIGG
jgi:hypothetical protein